MVETVKGKMLIGPIFSLIGGILLLIAAIVWFATFGFAFAILPIIAVPGVMSLILSLLALVGAFMAITGKMAGNYLALIAGIIAIIGMFIPIIAIPYMFTLVFTFIFVDPILILIGGILGALLKE